MSKGFQRGRTLKRANPNTIHDKVLVGYQGWFTCAGDGEPIGPGHHGWLHWFNRPIPDGGRPNTDYWPDTSDYDPSELYIAPDLKTASGDPVHLFSSRNPRTVRRHFHWMALHGVDGAFLQRFAGQCEIKPGNHAIRDLRDEIGDRVRQAAEDEGRVYAIMYDVSGVSPDKIQDILEKDWIHLLHEKNILDSPNYLHEKGKPVVALWGFGFEGRNHTPELVRSISEFFHSSVPQGVYLVAGTPGHWRTSTSDADQNPEFVKVWTECFDAISPWTVGRYGNEEEADRWGEERVKADAEYLRDLEAEGGRKIDYIPVVLPGGSGFNLSEGKWGMNDIKRNGGRFLWRQLHDAKRAGVRTIYCAMWDEYDEGTVFMPVVSHSSQLPVHHAFRFIALDVDGHQLPSDWYMRIAGFAAEAFHGERTILDTFPHKELEDYWSMRPRYEEGADDGGLGKQADVDEVERAFRQWEVSQSNVAVIQDDAPPPYSLEDTSSVPKTPPVGQRPQQEAQTSAGIGGRTNRPPLVRNDTRPSSAGHSHSPLVATVAGAAAIPLAAAAVMHMMPSGTGGTSTSSSTSSMQQQQHQHHQHSQLPIAPRVNMSSRPPSQPQSQTARPGHSPGEGGMSKLLPSLPQPSLGYVSGSGSSSLPPGAAAPALGHAAYDLGRPQPQPQHHPHAHHLGQGGSTSSFGQQAASPPPPMTTNAATGYRMPVPDPVPIGGYDYDYRQGRGRPRSRSRSKSRSKSRSSSRKRKHKHKHRHGHESGRSSPFGSPPHHHRVQQTHSAHSTHQIPQVYVPHAHGHGHSHGHSHSHSHSHSPVPGLASHTSTHSHASGYPSAGGLFPAPNPVPASPESGAYGSYVPMHSHPVGYGGHQGHPTYAYGHEHHGHGQPQPQGYGQEYGYGPQVGHHSHGQQQTGYGYGYGQGYGYDDVGAGPSSYQPEMQHGYTPHPSSNYRPPYAPGTAPNMSGSYSGGPVGGVPGNGNGNGGGKVSAGITTALHAVEGIAGRQTLQQLENTVKTLAHSGGALFSKLK